MQRKRMLSSTSPRNGEEADARLPVGLTPLFHRQPSPSSPAGSFCLLDTMRHEASTSKDARDGQAVEGAESSQSWACNVRRRQAMLFAFPWYTDPS